MCTCEHYRTLIIARVWNSRYPLFDGKTVGKTIKHTIFNVGKKIIKKNSPLRILIGKQQAPER